MRNFCIANPKRKGDAADDTEAAHDAFAASSISQQSYGINPKAFAGESNSALRPQRGTQEYRVPWALCWVTVLGCSRWHLYRIDSMDATLGLESRATHTLAFDLKNQNPQSNSFSKLVQIWSKYRSGPVNSVNMHVVRVDTDIMGFNFRDRARRLFIDTNRFRLDPALSDCLRLRTSAVCLFLRC